MPAALTRTLLPTAPVCYAVAASQSGKAAHEFGPFLSEIICMAPLSRRGPLAKSFKRAIHKSPDTFTGLRMVADGVVGVDSVFCVLTAGPGSRLVPV